MKIDINALPPATQYKLLCATVVPRPIALVTTRSENGDDNAAPFSFFNVMGDDPPVLVIGLEARRDSGRLKHTTQNIEDSGEFVVHIIDEAMVQAMNICAIDFPEGFSEAAAAGLPLIESSVIQPKRIADAPIAFECRKIGMVDVSPSRKIAIGHIVMMHVRDGLMDPLTHHVDPEQFQPVGRLFGRLYTRTHDRFELGIPSYADWQAAVQERR
jgi:flavin reductase (DIM6/NTAB) family NADH-FMN oxidoreductase RutF